MTCEHLLRSSDRQEVADHEHIDDLEDGAEPTHELRWA
jgi:hypothetical protein